MSATNSSKDSSDEESQESCGKKRKCAVSSNRHDMDNSVRSKREAGGGGLVAEENHQVNANSTMQKEESSATKMKPRLKNHSNIIIRKKKVSEDVTLSKQEKVSKRKRKNERCQAENEMAKKDAKHNEKKKRKKERKASDDHPAVAAGTDVSDLIHHEANMDDGIDMQTMNTKAKSKDENWIRLFMELVEYKEKNGHCNFPSSRGSLGRWTLHQRTMFTSKKLKADRYEKLLGIGFIFEDARFASDNEKWNRRFMELVEYKQKEGHCNLSQRNGTLGTWVSMQRRLFTTKKLKADRHEKLVMIGFAFEDQKFAIDNESWNRLFLELVEYKEKEGHCNFPRRNGSFGTWISTQRTLFRSKKLKEDRYEKLVGIGFA